MKMTQTLLYKENYKYDIQSMEQTNYFHMDYGTRYYEINMTFQHFHPFTEFYILLKGDCNHTIEGQSFPLKPLDIVTLKPYLLHQSKYMRNKPSQRLILTFSAEFIRDVLLNGQTLNFINSEVPIFRFKDEIKNDLITKLNNLYKTSNESFASKNIKIYSIFLDLIYTLDSNQSKNCYTAIEATSSKNKLLQVAPFIHKNYAMELSLDSLAREFYISPYYLSHKFKDLTGFTITQYIHMTRVKRAQELLLETDLKIIDVVERCGFGSLSQFNRIFKKITSQTPSLYRKNNHLDYIK